MVNDEIVNAMSEKRVTKAQLSYFLEIPALVVGHLLKFELADCEKERIMNFIAGCPSPARKNQEKPRKQIAREPELIVRTADEVKCFIAGAGYRQWQVAEKLNMDEGNFSRKLRNGATQKQWDAIVRVCEEI